MILAPRNLILLLFIACVCLSAAVAAGASCQMMRAVEITKPGGPEVLKVTERPIPEPKQGQVVIKVAWAGVNRPDALQRAGAYAPPPTASDLPGLEASGEVVAVGEGVTGVALGDKVCALLPGGC